MNPEDEVQRPTNLADLMAELVPPPEPAQISLVPQTLGWPVLAVLVTGLVVFAVLRIARHRRAEAYRKAALAALDAAGPDPESVARILRQTALTAFPRKDVAGLYGEGWLAFLDATCDGVAFRSDAGQPLVTAPYNAQAELPEGTLRQIRRWISHHRRAQTP
jgi:Ca-activated chloride channel family protein